MAFRTYGANEVPDLVSEYSVLAGKIDGTLSDGAVNICPNDWGSVPFDPRIDFGISDQSGGTNVTKRRLINVAAPTADTDAATKGYVDGVVPNIKYREIFSKVTPVLVDGKLVPLGATTRAADPTVSFNIDVSSHNLYLYKNTFVSENDTSISNIVTSGILGTMSVSCNYRTSINQFIFKLQIEPIAVNASCGAAMTIGAMNSSGLRIYEGLLFNESPSEPETFTGLLKNSGLFSEISPQQITSFIIES